MESWIRQWRNRRKHEQQVEIGVVEGEVRDCRRLFIRVLMTKVDEVDKQVVVVVSWQLTYGDLADNQDEVDHQVAEVVVDLDAVHQEEVVDVGVVSRSIGNIKQKHTGPPTILSLRVRYHRCQYYADSYESVD
jgi:hypothetical protein